MKLLMLTIKIFYKKGGNILNVNIKKTKFLLQMFSILFAGFIAFDYTICYAASYDFATGMPWDDLLTMLGNELTGPIAKILATIAVVTTGMMLMFGETSGLFKVSLQIVLGVSIAINAGDWVTYILSSVTPDASSVTTIDPVKAMTAPDFVSSFMMNFQATCMRGAYNLQAPVLKILGAFAVIDIALAVSLNLEQDHLKNIVKQTLKIGFFAFLVQQWVGGTYGIANMIFRTFEVFGLKAAGMAIADPDNIIANGLNMITQMWAAIMDLKFGSIGLIVADIIVMIGIVLSTFFMVIEIVMAKVEFWVISVLTIPLIPFGLLKYTNYLFEKATGAIFSLGIKLMVLSFVSAVAYPTFLTMAQTMAVVKDSKDISTMSVMLSTLLGCLMLFVLVKQAPALAQGLLSGTPSLGGSVSDGVRSVKNDYEQAKSVGSGVKTLGKVGAMGAAIGAVGAFSGGAAAMGAANGLFKGVGSAASDGGSLYKMGTNLLNTAVGAAAGGAKGLYDAGAAVGGVATESTQIVGSSFRRAFEAGEKASENLQSAGKNITNLQDLKPKW